MIKANELRVGNRVRFNNKVVLITFVGAKVCGIHGDKDDEYMIYERVNPIPLTPEILEKAGGRYQDKGNGFKVFRFDKDFEEIISLHTTQKGFDAVKNTDEYYWTHICNIKHLHQLQNLYFALTGEELKVNLNVEVTN